MNKDGMACLFARLIRVIREVTTFIGTHAVGIGRVRCQAGVMVGRGGCAYGGNLSERVVAGLALDLETVFVAIVGVLPGKVKFGGRYRRNGKVGRGGNRIANNDLL